jgi:AraC-like DNA-binding protein
MIDVLDKGYAGRLSLGTLAHALGRQSAYLGRLFREEMGVTVHEYVTRKRMENGEAQVRAGVKIEAVALTLGYQSKKNFYRQFKRRFGSTPEAYRTRVRDIGLTGPVSVEQPGSTEHTQPTCIAPPTTRATRVDPAIVDRLRLNVLQLAALAQRTMIRSFADSSVAMLVTDEGGRCIGANRAAISMTGYSVAELRGMPVEDLVSPAPGSENSSPVPVHTSVLSIATNAVLRTKTDGPADVHLIGARNLLWDRCRERMFTLAEATQRTSAWRPIVHCVALVPRAFRPVSITPGAVRSGAA